MSFLTLGFAIAGVKAFQDVRQNSEIRVLDCLEAAARPPIGAWVRVTGATGELELSAVKTRDDVIERIYMPLTCEGIGKPFHLVVGTEDRELINAAKRRQNARLSRDVEGMLRSSEDNDFGSDLHRYIDGMAVGYGVIEEGTSPSPLRAAGFLLGALVTAVMTVKRVRG